MELTRKDIDLVCQFTMNYEKSCTGCAQSTVATLLEVLDMENDDVFKAASGLANGIGRSGNGSCGALISGAMLLGLRFGRDIDDFLDPMAAMSSYDLVQELQDFFIAEFGSCRCADIQEKIKGHSFNLRDPKDIEAVIKSGMHDQCSKLVGKAAKKALEIIMGQHKKQ
jgi:C_GCAxxG_C_C family probable redox protein